MPYRTIARIAIQHAVEQHERNLGYPAPLIEGSLSTVLDAQRRRDERLRFVAKATFFHFENMPRAQRDNVFLAAILDDPSITGGDALILQVAMFEPDRLSNALSLAWWKERSRLIRAMSVIVGGSRS